jgi:hypothetical protein
MKMEGIKIKVDGKDILCTLENVNPKDVLLGTEYQRDHTPSRVKRMGKYWSILSAKFILINKRADGKLYCIDGSHRVRAAIVANEKTIPAIVYHGLILKREAEIFDGQKDTKRLSALESFNAGCIAGFEDCLFIRSELGKYKEFFKVSKGDGSDSFRCVDQLRRWLTRTNGKQTISETLELVKDVWGFEGKSKQRAFLLAASWVAVGIRLGEIDRDEFVNKLRVIHPDRIIMEASAIAFIASRGNTSPLVNAMLSHYNGKRRVGRVEFRIRGSV